VRCPLCGTTFRRARWHRGRATCAHCGRTWNVQAAINRHFGRTWYRRVASWVRRRAIDIDLYIRYWFMARRIRHAARTALEKGTQNKKVS